MTLEDLSEAIAEFLVSQGCYTDSEDMIGGPMFTRPIPAERAVMLTLAGGVLTSMRDREEGKR